MESPAIDRRDEKVNRQVRRVPQRVKFGRRDEEQGAQRGLVQGGQHHAEDRQQHGQFDHDTAGALEPQPLQGCRRKFDEEHGQVKGHAGGHLKEQGGGAALHDERVGQAPGTAHVVVQGQNHQGVTQKTGQDGRANGGVVVFHTEDIYGGRGDEAAGGQGDAHQQVEPDPYAPGVVVGQVGDRIQPLSKAQDGQDPPPPAK